MEAALLDYEQHILFLLETYFVLLTLYNNYQYHDFCFMSKANEGHWQM